jgi:hypothetical protein
MKLFFFYGAGFSITFAFTYTGLAEVLAEHLSNFCVFTTVHAAVDRCVISDIYN